MTIPLHPHKDSDDLQYHAPDYKELSNAIEELQKKLDEVKKQVAALQDPEGLTTPFFEMEFPEHQSRSACAPRELTYRPETEKPQSQS